ncbi:hypothetical protein SAMN05444162_3381 [Paenibacillaceae bacterium GAS479]|nr:hypothetical protein SAMN05444162_3381 [Paenibacillaceae bacterium GAS479]
MELNTGEIAILEENSPTKKKQSVSLKDVLLIAAMVLVSVALAAITWMYMVIGDLRETNVSQTKSMSDLSVKVSLLQAETSKITPLQTDTAKLRQLSILAAIQHIVEGGAVTDDFVVNKLTLMPGTDTQKMYVTIDLDTQPDMLGVYSGKGKFDLPDRELRAKSQEIIDQVKRIYESQGTGVDVPEWSAAEISLTIKNYPIGDNTAGEFKLVGEK